MALIAAAEKQHAPLPAASALDIELAPTDFARLAQFKAFDDDQLSIARKVVALFSQDAFHRVPAIEHAIRSNDAQALSWACHALVGTAEHVGASAMQALAAGVEQQAKSGSVPVNALQVLEQLHVCWLQTRAVVDAAG